jgi:alpha-L-arabinofuranosidase
MFINKNSCKLLLSTAIICCFFSSGINAQTAKNTKKISPDLFGLFFEDINYAADGGLYAELVQNRSFEYSPTERTGWNPLSYWEYASPGFSYGQLSVETNEPVHHNNPHYVVLNAEHVGHEAKYSGLSGVGIKNAGFEGMVIKAGEKYSFSMFAKLLSNTPVKMKVILETRSGALLAVDSFTVDSKEWKKQMATLQPVASYDTANLIVLATTEEKLAMDEISLFPEHTFKNRPNGLRADLAQVIADMKPKFIRFPGGCLAHGDGLNNMYRWENTIGPVEQRIQQRNIWGYHQTAGLGYFEYFQFCEDIGAKALPVLPAGVSCQNTGGTWRIGGTGQKAIPMDEMQAYVQEVLNLVEWANGPATSVWGAKRAVAGHPEPFHLEYIGIGNEDKITPEFAERFKMIFDALKSKHPEITIVGTVGPVPDGEDFDKGWAIANELKIPVVDEHYYTDPKWFVTHQHRYDSYKRNATQVYLGEYASWGNKQRNAIAEAAYMTALERNGDVVRMASYAPMLAKKGFTQWGTDMIFFDNTSICLTPNYYVQKLFAANAGDTYVSNVIVKDDKDSTLAASCVQDRKTGDVIVKLVNYDSSKSKKIVVDLSTFKNIQSNAQQIVLVGNANAENSLEMKEVISPVESTIAVGKKFSYNTPPMSLTVVRIRTRKL